MTSCGIGALFIFPRVGSPHTHTLVSKPSTASAPFAAPGNLVRLSGGIEAVEDLIADLEGALVPVAAARA